MTATRCLDFMLYERIEKTLKAIGKKDLYDFLGKPPNTSVDELLSIAKAEYGKATMMRVMNTLSVATKDLVSFAMALFKDANKKKYYDIFLATKNIWENFAALSRSVMAAKDFSLCIEKAKEALKPFNIAEADIVNLLNEGLDYFRISMVEASGSKVETKITVITPKPLNNKGGIT